MGGLFATILGASPREEAPNVESWDPTDDRWYSEAPDGLQAIGRRVSPDIAMQFSAVYAAVNLLSKTVAALPLRMYRMERSPGGQFKSFEAPEHPLNDLLEYQPNRWQTAFDFKAMMMMHAVLRGNGYAEIVPGPRGFADRLEPIHPDRVQVKRLNDGTLAYDVSDWRGRLRTLLQDEVFHVRSPIAPGLVGIGPITYARQTVSYALALEEHGQRTMANGARPSGVVTVKGTMGDEEFERFKKELRAAHFGATNTGNTIVLEDGAEFKPISMNAVDAEFLASREFQIAEICRWFDVPPVLVHHLTKTTSWGTGVEAIMLAFVRNNLNPWLQAYTHAIRRDLILVPNLYEARFDLEDLIRGDSKAQAEFYSRLVLNGILTRNEARAALGYNPLDGLDDPLTPTNTATSDGRPGNGGGEPQSALLGHNGGPALEDEPDEEAPEEIEA